MKKLQEMYTFSAISIKIIMSYNFVSEWQF